MAVKNSSGEIVRNNSASKGKKILKPSFNPINKRVWFIGERALGYPLMRGTILKEEEGGFLVSVTSEADGTEYEGFINKQRIRYEGE